MGPIITCFFIKIIYLLIRKLCKFYCIVVKIFPGKFILEIYWRSYLLIC